MADFEYTGVLYLMGSHDTRKDEVQWNGSTDQALSGTVVDGTGVGAGVLSLDDEYSETHTFGVGSYTGWYVTISLPGGGSAHYGIFDTGVSPWGLSIPYDAATVPADFATLVGTSSVGAVLGNSASLSGAANCFSTGTRIATPRGERPIEALAPGDTVLTAWGARRRVVWVWRQTVANVFGLADGRAPVRVLAHALGPDRPSRDLIITADHGLMIDGLLINAGALVNGGSIARVGMHEMPPLFTYWHIETEAHDVILAENCPAESFIDYAGRQAFDNYDAYLARYGAEAFIQEHSAPRISSARLLPPALRARLHRYAGHAHPQNHREPA